MARRPFGGTTADVAQDVAGDRVAGAQVTVWTAATGGTKLTDLQSPAGGALAGGVVASDANGIIAFLGPSDGTAVVYVDGGLGGRTKMVATDLADRVGTLESTPGGVASVAGRTGVVVLSKADVGLGNVDNTADASKPVSTAQQTALNLKANLASPAFTGTPTAPTPATSDNSTTVATTAFVKAAAAGSSVASSVTSGDTTHAPSGDAVYTALTAKADTTALTAKADTSALTAEATARAAGDALNSPAGSIFGLDPAFTDGTLNKPWKPAAAQTANLASGATLPITQASAATTQTVRLLRVDLGATRTSLPMGVRVLFTVDIPQTSTGGGAASLVLSLRDSSGNTVNADVTVVGPINNTAMLNYVGMAEVKFPVGSSPRYLDFNGSFQNTYTGTMSLNAADVRIIPDYMHNTDMLRVGCTLASADTVATVNGSARFMIDRPVRLKDARLGRIRNLFLADGALELAYAAASAFLDSRYLTPQPGGSVNNLDVTGATLVLAPLHTGNNDLVMSVRKGDGSYELRCNTHNGEVGRNGSFKDDFQLYYDRGYGTWDRCHGDNQQMHAYRAQVRSYSKVTRSDAASPFANIDRVYTFFADGVVRVDRTISFLSSETINRVFHIMNSIDPGTVPLRGRIGRGQRVLKEFQGMRPPAGQGVTITSGIASGVTTVACTTITQYVSPDWVGSRVVLGYGTGNAETKTVTGVSGTTLTLDSATANSHNAGDQVIQVDDATTLASACTVGAASLSLTDTVGKGAVLILDQGGPKEEGIRLFSAVSGTGPYTATLARSTVYSHPVGTKVTIVYPSQDNQSDGRSQWCVYQEPEYGATFGQIFDRAAILAHYPANTSLFTNLVRNSDATFFGAKAYTVAQPDTTVAVTSSTVWNDTFYWYYYTPRDPARFHDEIAQLASSTPAQLAAMYPSA